MVGGGKRANRVYEGVTYDVIITVAVVKYAVMVKRFR